MKHFKRAAEWLFDHPGLFWIVVLMLALLFAFVNREPAKYVQAPAEFCTSASTGQVREWDSTSMQCVSTAQNGTCSAWMPYTTHHVERQERVTCDWLEWR